jgi:hypothetical protein
MRLATRSLLALFACTALAVPAFPRVATAQETACCLVLEGIIPGTPNQPPGCPAGYTGHLEIISGLPPGTTIDIAPAVLVNFLGLTQVAGGSLGGNKENWNATMQLTLSGTGSLVGFNRSLSIAMLGESHSAPRVPFAASQSFATDMAALQGQLPVGDPDFDLLRITAGTSFGLPSPGHTIFTQSGFYWAVDSFFDITYRIDFVGHSGGPIGGMSGSTTGTFRFSMCHDDATPARKTTWGALKAHYR